MPLSEIPGMDQGSAQFKRFIALTDRIQAKPMLDCDSQADNKRRKVGPTGLSMFVSVAAISFTSPNAGAFIDELYNNEIAAFNTFSTQGTLEEVVAIAERLRTRVLVNTVALQYYEEIQIANKGFLSFLDTHIQTKKQRRITQ